MLSFAPALDAQRTSRPTAPAQAHRPEIRPPPVTPPLPAAREAIPAPVPAPPAKSAIAFDGDWPGLVGRLQLTGLAGMVARHGELASFDNGNFELVVPETHRMYAEKAYQDKLKAELQQHFGQSVRLTVRVGSTAGISMAAALSREAAKRQAHAAEAIEEDPFVRDLVRDLGAEVVPSSIRPAEDAAGPTSEKKVTR